MCVCVCVCVCLCACAHASMCMFLHARNYVRKYQHVLWVQIDIFIKMMYLYIIFIKISIS